MEVKGTTKVCGVIGNPVEHSISPAIHNTLASLKGDDLIYVPFHVKKGLAKAIEGAYALGILGLNITVPYKEEVILSLHSIDPLAGEIGAVNTLVREEGGYRGYNTDILGFERALLGEGVDLKDKDAVMIGAGGVARAVSFLLASRGVRTLTILNRTEGKARDLAREVSSSYPGISVTGASLTELQDRTRSLKDIIAVQCTSVGLYPNTEASPLDGINGSEEFFKKTAFAFDAIYRPEETAFLSAVRKAGGKTLNGLSMLLYQGVSAYELWNNTVIGKDEAEKVFSVMKGCI